jgi:hypothetical protein
MKRYTSLPSLHSPVGERVGGCFLWSPKDLLNKNVIYASIIINSTLKTTFLLKTSETKKFLKGTVSRDGG